MSLENTHKSIRVYMGILTLGINTLYMPFWFSKLFAAVGKRLLNSICTILLQWPECHTLTSVNWHKYWYCYCTVNCFKVNDASISLIRNWYQYFGINNWLNSTDTNTLHFLYISLCICMLQLESSLYATLYKLNKPSTGMLWYAIIYVNNWQQIPVKLSCCIVSILILIDTAEFKADTSTGISIGASLSNVSVSMSR